MLRQAPVSSTMQPEHVAAAGLAKLSTGLDAAVLTAWPFSVRPGRRDVEVLTA